MDDGLRTAAERLLKFAQVAGKGQPWEMTTAHKAVYQRTESTRIGDERAVCEAWLADHPADEGEPITREWLAACGFGPVESRTGPEYDDDYEHPCGIRLFEFNGLCWCFAEWDKYQFKTRGQIRLLFRALGEPLTELG